MDTMLDTEADVGLDDAFTIDVRFSTDVDMAGGLAPCGTDDGCAPTCASSCASE